MLQEEVKAFLSLALRHGGRMTHRQPRVLPFVLVVWCWVSCHLYARSQTCEKQLSALSCVYVCPHGTSRPPAGLILAKI